MVQPPPFVYGFDELLLTVIPVLIVVGIVGPKWLRELRQRKAAEAEQP